MPVKFSSTIKSAASRLNTILTQHVQRVERDVDAVVLEHAHLLRNDIIGDWPVDTGLSRAAWSSPDRVGYAHYRLVNPVVYAAVIEYGGYPGVGPKTAQEGGSSLPGGVSINPGIYPTQKPHAPVRRALSKRIVALEAALKEATVPR